MKVVIILMLVAALWVDPGFGSSHRKLSSSKRASQAGIRPDGMKPGRKITPSTPNTKLQNKNPLQSILKFGKKLFMALPKPFNLKKKFKIGSNPAQKPSTLRRPRNKQNFLQDLIKVFCSSVVEETGRQTTAELLAQAQNQKLFPWSPAEDDVHDLIGPEDYP